jgi:hypothetical protein
MGRKTSVHEQLNMCFGYSKTYLRTYITFKIFPGLYPWTPVEREGRRREGRGGREWIAHPVISVESCSATFRVETFKNELRARLPKFMAI